MDIKVVHLFNRQLEILKIEQKCRELDQVEIPVEHHFAPGVYARTMKAKAGTFAVGKRHRFEILNIITKGRALIYAGGDEPPKEIIGPCTFIADPQTRKIAFFIEDTEWMNIHPTDETDLAEIEKKFIMSEDEYLKELDATKKITGGA